MTDWHIVEVEVWGPNGFNVKTTRSNPAAVGAVTGTATYASFLSSMLGRSKDFPSNTIAQDLYHFIWITHIYAVKTIFKSLISFNFQVQKVKVPVFTSVNEERSDQPSKDFYHCCFISKIMHSKECCNLFIGISYIEIKFQWKTSADLSFLFLDSKISVITDHCSFSNHQYLELKHTS